MGAVLAGLPLFFGGIGCWLSGLLQPRLARRFGQRDVAPAAPSASSAWPPRGR